MRLTLVCLLVSCIAICSLHAAPIEVTYHDDGTIIIDGIYGRLDVTDGLLCDIIRSDQFTRLRGVHQYGPWKYVTGPNEYTRWEHSLGVFQLTVIYGGSYLEQVAALLHDVSHTIFSHVGGWIYHSDYRSADRHQDDIHAWFIEQSGLARLLEDYGINPEGVHHKNGHFPVLEQPLPNICTDRLDYNLQGAYYDGMMTQEDIDVVLQSLKYEDGIWYFDDPNIARMFALNSVFMTRNIWGGPVSGAVYYLLGAVLRYAVETGILSYDDIHFSYDDYVWNTLWNANDPVINEYLFIIRRHQALLFFDEVTYDFWVQSKFRGIDPYIALQQKCLRLSECDDDFARLFNNAKAEALYGWPIRCVYRQKEV